MPILANEIKYFKSSSGVGLGGAISATQITTGVLNNLFDDVSSAEGVTGKTEYRCFYVKNTNATIDLISAIIFIATNTASADTEMTIGLGTAAIDATEQTIPNEATAPAGVVFDLAEDVANALAIGTLTANGSYKSIWVKRVVDAGAVAAASDSATFTTQGETTV